MPLSRWSDRSPEEAALLNPAIFAVILFRAAEAYWTELGRGLPYELGFLVPPVVLVRATRQRLPRQTRTSLPAWLEENPDVRANFGAIAEAMAPLVREGVLFGCTHKALTIAESAIVAGRLDRAAPAALRDATDEVREILQRAAFLGKWYAHAGPTETVLALWGVRP